MRRIYVVEGLTKKLRVFFKNKETPGSRVFFGRWLFLRLLGCAYLSAFLSLWVQVDGLIGTEGIVPANEYIQAIYERLGSKGYRLVPTLFWFWPTDGFLHFLCGAGVLLSCLLIAGVLPGLMLIGLWLFYISLVNIGQVFLSFQWDILLLESGFLAIFFAPWPKRPLHWKCFLALPERESPPPLAFLWLLRWLLFRLMFASGVVKWASDETWRNLSALKYHYETQPLPSPIGWYAHQLPEWFGQASVAGVFVLELVFPFLIFAPRRWRTIGGLGLISLQVLIILSGNYAFFNWLTIALCLLLIDDRTWRRCIPKSLLPSAELSQSPRPPPIRSYTRILGLAFAALIFCVGTLAFAFQMFNKGVPPAPVRKILRPLQSFHVSNTYGLFANMTEERPEIIIEGSNDLLTWYPYSFSWKPGNVKHSPKWVAPHQPRLDWQMWFAALRQNCGNTPWFIRFTRTLLQGKAPVLDLLQASPFGDHPPRYVRSVLYQYHFTDLGARWNEGLWWQRTYKGLYCPPLSLEAFQRSNY